MAINKSAHSHRLNYPKPRIEKAEETSSKEAARLDPISYIRCWDKYNHGQAVDITKAKPMTRADLMKADPRGIELMLSYGVTQKQIAIQYNTPLGSLTSILKRMEVNTKVPIIISDVAQEKQEDSLEIVIESSSPTDQESMQEIWFTRRHHAFQGRSGTIITIKKDKVSFTFDLFTRINSEHVQFGLTLDNCLKVKSSDSGFRFHKHKHDNTQKSVCCAELIHELQKRGIQLPAAFVMKLNESTSLWEGALCHGEPSA